MRQRLKPIYRPLNRRLSIDRRGFIYLENVKICQYLNGSLAFLDRHGGAGQGRRIVEITPLELAAELVRVTETLENKTGLDNKTITE